jgi:hypothetical protein
MKRWIGALVGAVSIATLLAEDELPKPDDGEGLEIEPPLLIQSREPDGMPVVPASPQSVDIAKVESDLARARKSAGSGERLFKAGIIAKVEAEERVLRVVRLEAKLAEARLEEAKKQAESVSSEEAEADRKTSETAIAEAEQQAQRATEERHRAELEAALRNLQRQQKLLALGSGRKADVNRAEKKLADLQSGQN